MGRRHVQPPPDLGAAYPGRAEDRAARPPGKRGRSAGGRSRERAFIDAIHTFYGDTDKLDHRTRMVAYEKAMAASSARIRRTARRRSFTRSPSSASPPNDKTYAEQKQAAEILNRVLPQEPEHPGVAHYLIHSFDYPELAELALPAARVLREARAGIAARTAHAVAHLHPPRPVGRVDRLESRVARQSARLRRQGDARRRGFDELHAIDYLVYAYLQQGEAEKAKSSWSGRRREEARQRQPLRRRPLRSARSRHVRAGAAAWKEAAALTGSVVIDWEKTRTPRRTFTSLAASARHARGTWPLHATLSPASRRFERRCSTRERLLGRSGRDQRLAVAAWLATRQEAIRRGVETDARRGGSRRTTEKHPVTPGAIFPAREHLAEMLLDTAAATKRSRRCNGSCATRRIVVTPSNWLRARKRTQALRKRSKTEDHRAIAAPGWMSRDIRFSLRDYPILKDQGPIVVALASWWAYAAWMACPTCRGELWLCETHPKQSWPHCAALGIPCVCNPRAVMPSDFASPAEPERYRRIPREDTSDKPH